MGYKIRFEMNFNERRNRLLFVTDGILLSMLSNPIDDQLENIKVNYFFSLFGSMYSNVPNAM